MNKQSMDSQGGNCLNLIRNHDFSKGLDFWHPNCCEGFVVSGVSHNPSYLATESLNYAVITNRTETWQGLEQIVSGRISPHSAHSVSACVSVSGPIQGSADVLATLKLEYHDSPTRYMFLGKVSVTRERWETLVGSFTLAILPDRLVFYIEGPPPGADILIKSVVITRSATSSDSDSHAPRISPEDGADNVILNPMFEHGLDNWSGRGCAISLNSSMMDGEIVPKSGKCFACTTNRKDSWNGIQQQITGRIHRKLAYEVSAVARIFGSNASASSTVCLTLWVKTSDSREQYISVASKQVTVQGWELLQGKFLLNGRVAHAILYIEGPPAGTEILLDSLVLKHANKLPPSPPLMIKDPCFGVNIVSNSELSSGISPWFPLGNCTLTVAAGSPKMLPPAARESSGSLMPLSGCCLLVSHRTEKWMGPAQMITERLRLFLPYLVSAWVKVSSPSLPETVNVALDIDGQWVNGGQIECSDGRWYEIAGSFRVEKQPSKGVMVYVQGPAPNANLMVSGLQIFAVDRISRFNYLNEQIDKVRKRDVTLRFISSEKMCGASVKVTQVNSFFPLGSCISRANLDNEDFVGFFLQNFNWAVFANELKWYWTEPQKQKLNYSDADQMLDFCHAHGIKTRGHCIFWNVEDFLPQWVKPLKGPDLMSAVDDRMNSLLTRYRGRFCHYDVNNEMLHGSFFEDRLGSHVLPHMFKTANRLDPSSALFVNDYHAEDGCDAVSSPEKYISQILALRSQGAPVGGIGVQGHVDCPVGAVIRSALDKLACLGLPIWFTELDVSSENEHVRAEDLEVVLREAFAHPAVEGIMLWGFWELFMSRCNAHLVNAEGEVNEAGRRLVSLRHEWETQLSGRINEHGEMTFRGFHGTYVAEVCHPGQERTTKTFIVDKGDGPLHLSMHF